MITVQQVRESLDERIPRAQEEAAASHAMAMNSYGAGYDQGYLDALEELLRIVNDGVGLTSTATESTTNEQLFTCPECGSRLWQTARRVDERKEGGSLSPSSYVRCVQCKAVYLRTGLTTMTRLRVVDDPTELEPSRNAVEAARSDLVAAALSIEADLSDTAHSRLSGGHATIEEAHVRQLVAAARKFRAV